MSASVGKILIVDDNDTLRMTLSIIFAGQGYSVRSAADGFSALFEMRQEVPDVMISDLDMPGMSGFELLSVVRRRFPMVRVIAMSGAFYAGDATVRIAADAFYEKGKTGVADLVRVTEEMRQSGQLLNRRTSAPIWFPRTRFNANAEGQIVVPCPECLRVSPHAHRDGLLMDEASCPHCTSPIQFSLVQSTETGVKDLAAAWSR